MLSRTLTRRSKPQLLRTFSSTSASLERQRLVILGSGWGGYTLAKNVDPKLYDVTVISPSSSFSFTPLLASTCAGTLEPRCAMEAVRELRDIKFRQGWAHGISWSNRTVTVAPLVPGIKSGVSIPTEADEVAGSGGPEESKKYKVGYDKLVIAVGCVSNSFGTPGVHEHAYFLKDASDARAIRSRILECLELASQPFMSQQQRRDILSFRIVGGGPTGCELSAEIHDLIGDEVKKCYPELYPLCTITLYDVSSGILQSFDKSLQEYALKKFRRRGIDVKLQSTVTKVNDGSLEIKGVGEVPFGMLVWSTGLAANSFVENLEGLKKDGKTKSIFTDPYLKAIAEDGKVMDDVYAIGDNAMLEEGPSLPATAQVAAQKALWLASELTHHARDPDKTTKSFTFSNRGSMVNLGGYTAMIDRTSKDVKGPKGEVAGWAAWMLWRLA